MLKTINQPKTLHEAPKDHHRAVLSRYDAAQTHAGNEKHWSQSDSLSSGAALTPQVRKILRNRARYECDNNSYAAGMVETLSADTIATGPRIQLKTGDSELNQYVERIFRAWSNEIGLAQKLRVMRMARTRDGEAFGLLGTNPRLRTPVKLDIKCIEADQFSDPTYRIFESESDGIVYDSWGNPVSYSLLRVHPGSINGYDWRADPIPADQVIHYYKVRRPGQLRGVPDMTPSLPLFAMLRRYTLSVVTAAELAADMAGILYTDAAADDEGYTVDPLDTIEVVRGMFTTMPAGWKMSQLKAEQPTTMYGEFHSKILSEIARCMHIPRNVASGDSSEYNYASGRLDHQVYHRAIHVDRGEINRVILDHLWRAWLEEAQLVEGYLPSDLRRVNSDMIDHDWYWDGFKHVDPDKESKGDERRLRIGSLTIPDMYAEDGEDWEEQQRKQAEALGMTVEQYRARLADYLLGPERSDPEEQDNADEE